MTTKKPAATANLRVRQRLMLVISRIIEERGLRQREAAELFNTTQPRISEIVRGKVGEFTIDSLVNMFAAAAIPHDFEQPRQPPGVALDPVIEAYKPGVDRTLLRENLARSPTERVGALVALQRLAEEAAAARRRLGAGP